MEYFSIISCKEHEAVLDENEIKYVDTDSRLILDEKKDLCIIPLSEQDLIILKRMTRLNKISKEDLNLILKENFNNKVNLKLIKLNAELTKIEKEANNIQWFKSLRRTNTKLEAIIDYLKYKNNKSLEIDLIYIKAKIEAGEIPKIEISHCPSTVFNDNYKGKCEDEEYSIAEPKCTECWIKFLELEKDYEIFRKK